MADEGKKVLLLTLARAICREPGKTMTRDALIADAITDVPPIMKRIVEHEMSELVWGLIEDKRLIYHGQGIIEPTWES